MTAFISASEAAADAAIDEHDPAAAGLRDDVGFSGDCQDEQIVGQPLDGRGVGCRLHARSRQRPDGGAKNDPGSTADRSLQHVPACVSVLGHHGSR